MFGRREKVCRRCSRASGIRMAREAQCDAVALYLGRFRAYKSAGRSAGLHLRYRVPEDVVRPHRFSYLPPTRSTDRNLPLVGTQQVLRCPWSFVEDLLGRNKPELVAEAAPTDCHTYFTEEE